MFKATDKQKCKKRKGFSLVELVVVMAIIGILLVVMVPNYSGFVSKAKTIGLSSDARTLHTMVELVRVEHDIPDSAAISSLPATFTPADGTDVANLLDFIADLTGRDSEVLTGVTVGELPGIIETGVVPGSAP